MTHPTYEPLTTDYTVKWDELPEGTIPADKHHEHGVVEFDNGYIVSVLRSNAGPDGVTSKGFDEGSWEAAITRPTTNPIMQIMGFVREPATEMDHLTNHTDDDGFNLVVGDNAVINDLFAKVNAAPRYEGDTEAESMAFLDRLFGGTPEEGDEA